MKTPNTRRFTEEEMQSIADAQSFEKGFLRAWEITLGLHGQRWEEMETIEPTLYVIYDSDWIKIGELLKKKCEGDGIAPLLEWMNKGPSSAPAPQWRES
jgi:hypothetical protein